MIYEPFSINLSRLQLYYPEFKKGLDKLIPKPNDIFHNMTCVFDLQESETDSFQDRFAQLMDKYKIDQDFWADLIYINQVIIRELEKEQFFFELDPETSNAIDFLIGYQEIVNQEIKTGKKSGTTDPFVIQFKRKSQNGGVNLNYHGSAQLIMKNIFKAFKTSFANPTLSLLLEDYKEIPPIEVLKELNLPPAIKRDNLAKKLIQNSAEILSDYFEKYIPKEVHSRKKNLIIFELFYLFDTFQYAGSVLKVDTSSIKRKSLDVVYSLPFNKSKCSEMIKELLKKGKSKT